METEGIQKGLEGFLAFLAYLARIFKLFFNFSWKELQK